MNNEKKELTKEDLEKISKDYKPFIYEAIKHGYENFVLCSKNPIELGIASLLIYLRRKNQNINIYLPLYKMDENQTYQYFKLLLTNDENLTELKTTQIRNLKKFVVCCENNQKNTYIVENLKNCLDSDIKMLIDF